MIVLLSPAKTLDETPMQPVFHSEPRMLKESKTLVGILKKKKSADLQKLMGVSEKIADLNVARFKSFSIPFSTENAKPAVLAFKGDVYTGLKADEMNEEQLAFAQSHIRILSGLYGILRPMDLMQPYRLEMGTRLENKKGNNLYKFWGDDITRIINKDLKDAGGNTIINLASNEYFKSVKKSELEGELLTVNFKEKRNGVYKVISFNAKKARGIMARYIIHKGITDKKKLKAFKEDDYSFNKDLSTDSEWIFTR